mmetsp:Transcript_22613/g.66951  ORF Transcript_22613/g.66951 Transcript_22613/m.66951 type:complete len:98 (-) Transcript_22613:353-646(-)
MSLVPLPVGTLAFEADFIIVAVAASFLCPSFVIFQEEPGAAARVRCLRLVIVICSLVFHRLISQLLILTSYPFDIRTVDSISTHAVSKLLTKSGNPI